MTISNFFVPNRQTISSITQANPAVVTTSQSHGYSSGMLVRFFMPLDVGMNVLDGQVYEITVTSTTEFSIPVDTTNFDSFSIVGTVQSPQVIPVGNLSSALIESTRNNENITPEL